MAQWVQSWVPKINKTVSTIKEMCLFTQECKECNVKDESEKLGGNSSTEKADGQGKGKP